MFPGGTLFTISHSIKREHLFYKTNRLDTIVNISYDTLHY